MSMQSTEFTPIFWTQFISVFIIEIGSKIWGWIQWIASTYRSLNLPGPSIVSESVAISYYFNSPTILIANASLKSFYSRSGFSVIKDFSTSTTFEAACRQFHYDTGKSKKDEIKTIGLQCLYTIPRRVTFLHDDQINFNTQKNVFRDLYGISKSETFFRIYLLMMRSRKK